MPPRRSHIPAFRKVADPLTNARKITDAQVGEFARREAASFRAKIRAQDFESFTRVPLSPVTIQQKTLLKLDLRTMIATGHYTKSIKVIRWVPAPRTIRYRIGFADNDRAHDSDGVPIALTLNRLAEIHEKGSQANNIPARPHWGPHLQGMAQRATVVVVAVQNAVLRS